MSPNGRRAWRRFAKQQRRKVNRRNRQSGTPWINDADGAFYRHEQRFFAQRPKIPIKPFTARSLVGMTMGARKRKARYWMECERLHQKAQDFQEVVDRSVGRKSSLRTIGHTPISLRNHYRIGERLRPCPGCCACCLHPNGLNNLISWCDGSGVMPARKS